ncbi:MAG TPA: glycosyl hydrolase family 28-related protein [Chitinophagaceae bacterium]|nr:glycosyl hydrolase family 28-related protein [Chitinophagaceae bacterium]
MKIINRWLCCIWAVCIMMGTSIHAKAQLYDVTSYGAIGDGITDNTIAIQKAINECAKTGGKVYFPGGTFLTATLILKSNVTLHVSSNATILGHTDPKQYPYQDAGIHFYGEEWARQALIFCKGQENVGIEGSGTIDGQGASFVVNTIKKPDRYRDRPYLLWFAGCRKVTVKGISLRNSAFWMQHYLGCEFVWIDGIRVWNHSNKNNDLMDIDGCKNVTISNVIGDSDDDGITIKSTSSLISENITITNCVISSHCNAIKFGTESTGGFRNVVISNCVIKPSGQLSTIYGKPAGMGGLALEVVDGGIMENITIDNIVIDGPLVPIFMRLGNRARKHTADAAPPPLGRIRNISLSNIIATGADETGCSITGIAKAPIENISLNNIHIETKGGDSPVDLFKPVVEKEEEYPEGIMFGKLPSYGFFIRHAKEVKMSDITLRSTGRENRPGIVVNNASRFYLNGLDIQSTDSTRAIVYVSESKDGTITSNLQYYPARQFLLKDKVSTNIIFDKPRK